VAAHGSRVEAYKKVFGIRGNARVAPARSHAKSCRVLIPPPGGWPQVGDSVRRFETDLQCPL
jgi:hypothetical protein